jgi:hypothetical protein
LISEKTTLDYQKEFRKIAMEMAMVNSHEDWVELYKKLIFWELELENINDQSMFEILESQKVEANAQFGKFIERNYEDWFDPKADTRGKAERSGTKAPAKKTPAKKATTKKPAAKKK